MVGGTCRGFSFLELLVEPVGVVDEDAFEHPVDQTRKSRPRPNDAFTSAIVTGSSEIHPSATYEHRPHGGISSRLPGRTGNVPGKRRNQSAMSMPISAINNASSGKPCGDERDRDAGDMFRLFDKPHRR